MRFKTKYEGSSFSELLATENGQLFPRFDLSECAPGQLQVPHGTTVLAFKYADGVMVGGDRLATEGHRVASRDIQKVYPTDNHSVIAIAGAAGPCIEMARIMRVELEHYEKIEGEQLELDGKANKLAQMIRANLPAAMQGLVVVPLFAGYDLRRSAGRLWKFDVTGGRYEETEYEATGSGGLYARESLKKTHRNDVNQQEAVTMAVQALVDAADEDRATGGIDVVRGIFPILNFCTADGIERVSDQEIESVYRTIIENRFNGRGD
ncbi:proteasome subunit beta [Myxococcota bacterium]|nr:proteasome subunit beta [Myxococcota bacterium]